MTTCKTLRESGGAFWRCYSQLLLVIAIGLFAQSGQAQSLEESCRQGNPLAVVYCELVPGSFSDWSYSTGIGASANSEAGAIQNTMAAYFSDSAGVCEISYSLQDQIVVGTDSFLDSQQPLGTQRGMSMRWGNIYNGQCEGVGEHAFVTISGSRTAQCKPNWTEFWDGGKAASFCGIYADPTRPAPLSCKVPASPTPSGAQSNAHDGNYIGNPILGATGDKIQTEVDFIDSGSAPLSFVRTYRSTWGSSKTFLYASGSVGKAWSHNHAAKLEKTSGSGFAFASLTTGEGYVRFFMRAGAGMGWTPTNSNDTLVESGAGWTYRNVADESTSQFSTGGNLLNVTARNGRVTSYQYAAFGTGSTLIVRLAQINQAFGRTLRLAYDPTGTQLTSVTASDGRVVNYGYDSAGRLASVAYPDGKTRSYLYENASFPQALTGIVDESGSRFATFAYDGAGQTISTEHAGGVERYQVSYSGSGSSPISSTYVTDPLGNQRTYSYNTIWSSLFVTNGSSPSAAGQADAQSRQQDQNGLITSETDFKGTTTQYTWDVARRLPTSVTRAANTPEAQTVTTQWHPTFSLPVLITESGRTTAYTYDSAGNALSQTVTDTGPGAAPPRTWQWTYNAQNLAASQTEPNGAVTSYTYDTLGNLTKATNALGHDTLYGYDASNRVVSSTAPNGVVTSYTYDARDRLLSRTVASLPPTTLTYNDTGTLVSLTLPNGLVLGYTYDAAHRLKGWTNNRGESGAFTLDPMGNRTAEQIKNSAGAVAWKLVRSINAINRVASRTDGPNQSDSFGYDANGELITQTNGRNESTQYGLDGLRRVTAIGNAAGATASLSWNALDAVTQASDFKGVATSYARDAQGNATAEASADIGSRTTQLDPLGLPRQIVDALGQATTVTRDPQGRPTGIAFADGKTSALEYDLTPASKGYLSRITDRSGTTEYSRDALGRVTQMRRTLASGLVQQVGYGYAANGLLATLSYPNGSVLTHQYDATGRLTQLNWNGTPIVTGITWNPMGQPTGWTWAFVTPSLVGTRTYDTAGRLTASEFASYVYDAAGRITSLTQKLYKPADTNPTHTTLALGNVSWSVGYDAVGRITGFNATGNTADFGYDANGNRASSNRTVGSQTTSRTYTLEGSSNRLLGFDQTQGATSTSVAYGYNANGDLTSDGLRSFSYDAEGRLSGVTTGATDTSPTTRYAHNALGQRVFKTEPQYPPAQGDESDPGFFQSLINFFTRLWGPGTSDAEKLGYAFTYDEEGSLISEIGTGGANSTGSTMYISLPTAMGAMPIAAIVNGQPFAVSSDHLNTPRRITNASGQAVWQWSYSAFGDEQPTMAATRFTGPTTVPTTGTTSISPFVYNLRYAGQYYDNESGLSYNGFRSYSKDLGRYTQPDPIGLDGGWNKFGYVSGNPLMYTDPKGLAEYLGLPAIEGHLRWLAGIQGADFDKDPFDAPNREMLFRLRRGEESPWDVAFYRHEMAEADLCKPARGLPLEEALSVQKKSHESVLRNQQNRERDLYHPDVVFRNRSVFGNGW